MTYSRFFLVSVLIALLTVSAGSSLAQAQTAPSLEVDHAACYRSIIDADDLFCLARYELPDSISDGVSDAWCAELVDQDGCALTPAAPTAPTSLPVNSVFLTLYDGCTAGDCSAGTILNVSRVPRIGFALGGSYVNAGHTITWADTDVHLCVESSEDDYITGAIDCLPVFWNTSENTTEAQREVLGADMVEQIRAIGFLESESTTKYVENNLINATGKTFAVEALEQADRLLDVFSEGATRVAIPGFTPSAGTSLQSSIDTDTSAVQLAKTNFGNLFGLSGDAVGVLLSVAIVLVLFVLFSIFGGNLVFALVTSVSAATFLVLFGLLPFQVFGVLIVILALAASVKVVRVVTQ